MLDERDNRENSQELLLIYVVQVQFRIQEYLAT